jgi:hypothetical protein
MWYILTYVDTTTESLAQALRSNTSLTRLILWHTRIGDRGAESLAAALGSNTSLTDLDLTESGIASTDTVAIIAEGLARNKALRGARSTQLRSLLSAMQGHLEHVDVLRDLARSVQRALLHQY